MKCPLCNELTQADSLFNFTNNKALISMISEGNYPHKIDELRLPKGPVGSQ